MVQLTALMQSFKWCSSLAPVDPAFVGLVWVGAGLLLALLPLMFSSIVGKSRSSGKQKVCSESDPDPPPLVEFPEVPADLLHKLSRAPLELRAEVALHLCLPDAVFLSTASRALRRSLWKSVVLRLPGLDLLHNLGRSPSEIRTVGASFLPLSTLAALSCSSRGLHRNFWGLREVWSTLATRYGIVMPADMAERTASASQDAFRRGAFRVDCSKLDALASSCCKHATAPVEISEAVFAEATHVLVGLMPHDSGKPLQRLIELVVMPLQFHDPWEPRVCQAAKAFLSRARGRPDLLDHANLQLLEDLLELTLQTASR